MKKIFNEKTILIWDAEYTSWKGCNKKGWDTNKNQYREIVQIGAILIDTETYEIKKEFSYFIKPRINNKLSEFFIELTGINQKDVESAKSPRIVIRNFLNFIKNYDCYSYGIGDYLVLLENLKINNLNFKTNKKKFHDIREIFKKSGINVDKFSSGIITEAFGVKNKKSAHNALSDAKSILEGLKLISKGENPKPI